ncbi:TraR/DksA family transcriptional regulator [Pantoea allii]|uniref:TraR/DksA family transcriptional regulator n=1 Tax=Pantoea allii TaxID=574096 RepID=A0A2V2BJ06_9GAMM|nr:MULTISPECIES: TraR/DksA family transcriptional regulator [Pantoea]MBW1216500.1 TraR/DksA family transcriptional regulator [Pantoea allii]MBW1252126.1 TraR/DksA family transcriptional regulator [Pantoea allii]MBW1258457.1 TraR/DksA family transcriptional regulator [Pantoea allii]MBW1261406.1 TraR/DksA family transcriptional regulator [Pantoea allii]MBW1267678.1 TraR/DksA family transcriptional regulator [Pantoea allii]
MADAIDIAQQRSEEILAEHIAQVTQRPVAIGASFCEECDAPIPEARRRALQGVTRCLPCQELSELRTRLHFGHAR